MAQVDLFLSLAEIAGVFVGFAALIAVRSGGRMAVSEVNTVRWVVTTGIWAVIAALSPAILGSYGLAGHGLWVACGVLALALFAVMVAVFARAPENRAEVTDNLANLPLRQIAMVMVPSFWLPAVTLVTGLVLVVVGAFPDLERAIYVTAVALGLLMAALGLFAGVFWQRSGTGRPR